MMRPWAPALCILLVISYGAAAGTLYNPASANPTFTGDVTLPGFAYVGGAGYGTGIVWATSTGVLKVTPLNLSWNDTISVGSGTGRLGVGTDIAVSRLHVVASVSNDLDGAINVWNYGTGGACVIPFSQDAGGREFRLCSTGSGNSLAGGAGRFGIWDNSASAFRFLINAANGRIGIGNNVGSPSYLLSINGDAAQTVGMERHTVANTAGSNLSVTAGGAKSGATDKAGGDLVLTSGTATGTGKSKIVLQAVLAGATGTTDRTAATHLQIVDGHIESLGSTPTGLTCGTNSTLAGTDVAGKITIRSAAVTSCVFTFATAWTNAPPCYVSDETTLSSTTSWASTTTGLTISTTAAWTSGDVLAYGCLGRG